MPVLMADRSKKTEPEGEPRKRLRIGFDATPVLYRAIELRQVQMAVEYRRPVGQSEAIVDILTNGLSAEIKQALAEQDQPPPRGRKHR